MTTGDRGPVSAREELSPQQQDDCRPRVVVLARPSAANQYLFDVVADYCRLLAVLTQAPTPRQQRIRRDLQEFRAAPLRGLATPARRAVLWRLSERLDREVRAALPEPRSAVFADVQRLSARDLNGEPGVTLLRELAPDLLILSGAPLLKPQVYGIPSLGTVNLHWGIAPEYRGQESISTALRRGDYGAIGMTVHFVDEGVDTGPVLAQGWPTLEPRDTLATLWAKVARIGATMLADLVQAFGQGPVTGEHRRGPGSVVRSGDQRVWHHVRYGIDRAVLRRHPPHAEGRLVRYWSPVFPAATGTTSVPGSNTSAEDRRPT